MLVIGQCIRTVKRIFTSHACVSGQNASCARAVVLHFAELTDFFLQFRLKNTDNKDLRRESTNSQDQNVLIETAPSQIYSG